jgi:hypothetical protein
MNAERERELELASAERVDLELDVGVFKSVLGAETWALFNNPASRRVIVRYIREHNLPPSAQSLLAAFGNLAGNLLATHLRVIGSLFEWYNQAKGEVPAPDGEPQPAEPPMSPADRELDELLSLPAPADVTDFDAS